MKKNDVFITSATRTAVASLGKSLKNIPADNLGACVIEDALNKSGIKKNEIDEIIFGQVLTGRYRSYTGTANLIDYVSWNFFRNT